MICNNCGAELAEGSMFCNKCGNKIEVVSAPAAEVEPEKRICPGCGAELAEGSMFCNKCGHKIEVASAPAAEVKPAPYPAAEVKPAPYPAAEVKPVSDPGKNICPRCGAEIVKGCIFCNSCGYKMQASPASIPTPTFSAVPRSTPVSGTVSTPTGAPNTLPNSPSAPQIQTPQQSQQSQSYSPFGFISLGLGIFSWFINPLYLFGIAGIALGFAGMNDCKNKGKKGIGFAIAGMVVSVLSNVAMVILNLVVKYS